jgi:hypothetical protein
MIQVVFIADLGSWIWIFFPSPIPDPQHWLAGRQRAAHQRQTGKNFPKAGRFKEIPAKENKQKSLQSLDI